MVKSFRRDSLAACAFRRCHTHTYVPPAFYPITPRRLVSVLCRKNTPPMTLPAATIGIGSRALLEHPSALGLVQESRHWQLILKDAVEHWAGDLWALSGFVLLQLLLLAALILLLTRHFRTKEQLRSLMEAAQAIARGDRLTRSRLSEGPLAPFGQTFDDMVTLLSNEIRSLRSAQRELEQLVATDRLTGVANRRHFEQLAEVESARVKRYGIPASLILF